MVGPLMQTRIPHPRYVLFLAGFLLGAVLAGTVMPIIPAVLVGFDVGVAVFILSCIALWRHGQADRLRRDARNDDAGRILLLLLTLLIAATIMGALGLLVLLRETGSAFMPGLIILTLCASWLFVNLIYALHYARLYFDEEAQEDRGGLLFPDTATPEFADFVNFAFVIGMTCQTADVAITGTHMRRVSTFHGLFAFAFNLVILALTINVLAAGIGG